MDSLTEIARLRTRVTELEREKEAVERFAAMAAHELLTPVVLMDACAATVCDRLHGNGNGNGNGDGHAEALEQLGVLRRGAAQSRLLVETLLHHAAFQQCPLELRPVALSPLVSDCIAVLAPEIRRHGATVEVGPLPRLAVEERLIGSVFMNLLTNALKYGPRHGGTIAINAVRMARVWQVGVESEGEPIPAADRERIFQPYRRGTGERRARGSGLGLTICHEIVERHGGRLGVVPLAGGNRFQFTLPADTHE
jgi:signal transduction histidine kinase